MTTKWINMAAICKNCQELRAKHNGEVIRGCFYAYVVCPGERGAEGGRFE